MYDKQQIIISHLQKGENISSIARKLNLNRRTVRKYIKAYQNMEAKQLKEGTLLSGELADDIAKAPKYDSSNRKRRKLSGDLIEVVKQHLEENTKKRSRGQHKQLSKKIDIYENLCDRGFDIGYTTICNFIGSLEDKHSEAFIKQTYSPGDVCEFDWGEAKIFIGGKLKVVQQAVFTSAYGNYRFSVLYFKQNTQCFQEAHALFFSHLKGVYRTVVYDNMRTVVRKFVGQNEKEPTEGLLQLSTYYKFDFRFCNVRSGNEKGHVEKSVGYIRQKAFSKKDQFNSLEEANAYLLEVCEQLNRRPQTGNKNKTAMELLDKEKEYLIPSKPLFESSTLSYLKVDKYSTIIVDRCHYSVPDQFTGKVITVKAYASKIICFYQDKKICSHDRVYAFCEWIIELDHYLNTLKKKPGAIINSVAFSQIKEEYRLLFERYYSDNPKDFIELLIYIRDKKLSFEKVKSLFSKLAEVCPNSISTDKIKAIHERNDTQINIEKNRMIEDASIKQLAELSLLLSAENKITSERGVI
jgi:transposase/transposase-like protein